MRESRVLYGSYAQSFWLFSFPVLGRGTRDLVKKNFKSVSLQRRMRAIQIF